MRMLRPMFGIAGSEVDAAIATLDPTMSQLNAGFGSCSTISSANQTAWQQAFARWQQVKTDWAFNKGGSIAPGPVYGDQILQRVQESTNDASAFQSILQLACPNVAPAPPAPVINPMPLGPNITGFGDQVVTAAKAIGLLTLVGVGAYAIYEIASVASDAARKRQASRRKAAA